MKVIFLQDVRGVARRSDTKEVSDGYAKNFLIPRGLAKSATISSVHELETKHKREAEEIDFLKKKLIGLQESLKKQPLVLHVKVGEHNEIFGGVHSEAVERALEKRGVTGTKIELDKPIKAVGEHFAKIKLRKGIFGTISLEVRPG